MKCIPLLSIIKALGITIVDYFSLDIEGAELQLLQALDFDQVDIKVMSIEISSIGRIFDGSYTKLDYMLRNRGYVKYAEVQHDALYVKKDLFENNYQMRRSMNVITDEEVKDLITHHINKIYSDVQVNCYKSTKNTFLHNIIHPHLMNSYLIKQFYTQINSSKILIH